MVGRRPSAGIAALAAALCALALPAVVAPAQDSLQETPRRVLFLVADAEGSPGRGKEGRAVLADSILLSLQSSDALLASRTVLVPPRAGSVPADDEARGEEANARGVSAWVLLEIGEPGDQTAVHVRSWDYQAKTSPLEADLEMPGALSPMELPAADWSGLAALVAKAFPPVMAAAAPAAPASARLSVKARPGSVVKIRGVPDVAAGEDGIAAVDLPAPAEYVLAAERKGFRPASARVYLGQDAEVELVQAPAARWGAEAALADLGYPTAMVSWYFVPDWASVSLGVTEYALALALNDREVFTSRPLVNVGLRAGSFISPVGSWFRLYAGAEGFLRVVFWPAELALPPGIEPLSPAGVSVVVGAVMGGDPRGGPYLEMTPTLFFTNVTDLFRASMGGSDYEGWIWLPKGVLSLLSFRLGWRWMP